MLLAGPSGIGKSSLLAQFILSLIQGLPWFGFIPTKAARVLLVQAENDLYDLKEMFAGFLE